MEDSSTLAVNTGWERDGPLIIVSQLLDILDHQVRRSTLECLDLVLAVQPILKISEEFRVDRYDSNAGRCIFLLHFFLSLGLH